VWRFYIFYNRPEKSDAQFVWNDFKEKVNGELIGNLGNLVNRTLLFIIRYYDGKLPIGLPDQVLWERVRKYENSITEKMERVELRDAFREIFELSSYANKYFQDAEPWRRRTEDPVRAKAVIRDLAHIVRDIAILIDPFMPQIATRIISFFGLPFGETFDWKNIGSANGLDPDNEIKSEVLFTKLEDELIDSLRERFSGSQNERQQENAAPPAEKKAAFEQIIDLRVAKIEKVEKHPKADKLYIINLEIGEGTTGTREERTIVSGLVNFYTQEQLLGKKIIVAYNLKPAKLRGVESRGMLLAAGDNGGTPAERCEVLDAGDAPTGTRLLPSQTTAGIAPGEITIETFLSYPITVKNFTVQYNETPLCLNGKQVRTGVIGNGDVH